MYCKNHLTFIIPVALSILLIYSDCYSATDLYSDSLENNDNINTVNQHQLQLQQQQLHSPPLPQTLQQFAQQQQQHPPHSLHLRQTHPNPSLPHTHHHQPAGGNYNHQEQLVSHHQPNTAQQNILPHNQITELKQQVEIIQHLQFLSTPPIQRKPTDGDAVVSSPINHQKPLLPVEDLLLNDNPLQASFHSHELLLFQLSLYEPQTHHYHHHHHHHHTQQFNPSIQQQQNQQQHQQQHRIPTASQNDQKTSYHPNIETPFSGIVSVISHHWKEISGLCFASALFLNWIFVIVKRKFIDLRNSHRKEKSSRLAIFRRASNSKDTNTSALDSGVEETPSPIVSLDSTSSCSSKSSLRESSSEKSTSSPLIPPPAGQFRARCSTLRASQPIFIPKPIREPSSHSHSGSLSTSLNASDFISRYTSDFESIQRLGRGGFGIVFEAKNKLDDCRYAVKRICLPYEKEARERVMREVRALAKLDHTGIVRYYNAWLETPPDEWLKEHDSKLGIIHSKDGPIFPSTDGIYEKNDFEVRSDKKKNKRDKKVYNNIGIGGNGNAYCYDDSDSLSVEDDVFKCNGFHSDSLKRNSSSPSLDIVFDGSGSIRQERKLEKSTSEVIRENIHVEKIYLYIQMQLCRKDTLKDWLKTNDTERDKVVIFDLFYQIVDAVEYVHSQDLIHRDLKPSNIFFSMDGIVKIGDFGLVTAKSTGIGSSIDLHEYVAESDAERCIDAAHTEQVGTQLYMSPEQLNGISYNHKVDVFAMGLILLELLVPFKTQMQRVNVLFKARNNLFSEDFKREHSREHELVKGLLSRTPQKRPTATEIKQHELLASALLSPPVIDRINSRRRTISSSSSSNE